MNNVISLTPGFSPVMSDQAGQNRFNGFSRAGKPPTIKQSGNGMLVSWPSASAGWALQQCPDLATANWSPSGYSGYTISDDGTNKSLVIPLQPGNLFFRQFHPWQNHKFSISSSRFAGFTRSHPSISRRSRREPAQTSPQ